jgi:glycosyltransferase involved in cell wall biosynthesis
VDNQRVFDLSPIIGDFVDTVCLIEQLDLVIAIDTSVAHLAGAMGKPVWVLLPFVPDWRWLLDREDTLWYPNMRLFRQQEMGDWDSVFREVKEKLKIFLNGESPLLGVTEIKVNQSQPIKVDTSNLIKSNQNQAKLKESEDVYVINIGNSETENQTQSQAKNIQKIETNSDNYSHKNYKQIGITWSIGSPTGWGVYGWNLALQLRRNPQIKPILLAPPTQHQNLLNPLHHNLLNNLFNEHHKWQNLIHNTPQNIVFDFPVLSALGNSFSKPQQKFKGNPHIGMIFFENTQISPQALANGRNYDLIITGSTWNEKVLRNYGLTHVKTLIQGIDPTIFHPAPKSNLFGDRFVIFSGGKLEYRKGQDLVIAAFKIFRQRHHEALLLTAWHNFWPQFMQGLETTGNVNGLPQITPDKRLLIKEWLVNNGIPSDAVIDLGAIPNHLVGQILREADVSVFPNRCEGGTNLAAMESLACGIPTILSHNTGHLDLIEQIPCYPLHYQAKVKPNSMFPGVDNWGDSSIEEIVETLETIYQHREEAKRKGEAAAIFMQNLTWAKQADKLLNII